MGLFDFAKNIGESLFQSEEEAAEKVKARILENNPGVENLQVSVADGVASITCEAKDRAAAEKAILMIGNVRGISQVNYDIKTLDNSPIAGGEAQVAEAPASPEANTAEAASPASASNIEVLYYDIQSGDTLSGIAKRFLGDANKYNDIFKANQEVIVDVDKIYPGQKIRIPVQ